MKKSTCTMVALFLVFACASIWAQTSGPGAKAGAGAAQPAKAAILDINSAGKEELMKLPGIGDAFSTKIIRNRPYRSKDELVRKKIIPQATYDKIRDMIIARQK